MKIAEKLNFIKGKANYYRSKMLSKLRNVEYAEALENGKKFVAISENSKNPEWIANAYGNIALVYASLNDVKHFSFYIDKASVMLLEQKDSVTLADLYANLSGHYQIPNHYETSIDFGTKALTILENLKDTFGIAQCHLNMSSSFGYLNQDEAWRYHLRLALNYALQFNNEYLKIYCIASYVELMNYDEKYDSSLYYSTIAEELAQKKSLGLHYAGILLTKSEALVYKKNYAQAEKAIGIAKKIILNKGNNIDANIYLNLYDAEYEFYKAQGQYKKAMEAKALWSDYNDSLYGNTQQKTLTQLNLNLQKNELDNQILQKQIKIEEQRVQILYLILGFFVLFFVSITWFLLQHKKKQIDLQKIKTLEKEKELNATKSNLEGQLKERSRISKEIHDDLGSSLTSISLLTEVLKKRIDTDANPEVNKISATSADMVDKMNEIIWALNTSNDTINSLIAYVRKFSNHFLEDAGIHLQFEEPLIPETMAIEGIVRRNIYLTIKEAINNIVKHAGAANVHLQVNMDNGLHINIQDDGKGIAFDTLPAFRNGLTNMKKRMEDIGGTLNIESTKGTLIKLFYPIKTTA
jgi:signal transduction histidine kinase